MELQVSDAAAQAIKSKGGTATIDFLPPDG